MSVHPKEYSEKLFLYVCLFYAIFREGSKILAYLELQRRIRFIEDEVKNVSSVIPVLVQNVEENYH